MWRSHAAAAGMLLVLALAAPTLADVIWQAPAGDWFTPAHWSGGVPGATDTAVIDNGGVASITSGTAVAGQLRVGASEDGGRAGAVDGTGGRLSTDTIQLGWASGGSVDATGAGALTGTDMDWTVVGQARIGYANSSGNMGAAFRTATGTGTLLRGEVSVGPLSVGYAAGRHYGVATSTGSLTVDQSTFSGAGAWDIGTGASGYGGSGSATGTVSVLGLPGSVSDLTSLTVGSAGVGYGGEQTSDGSLTYRGGLLRTGDWSAGVAVAAPEGGTANATGMVDLADLTLLATGNWTIGSAGGDRNGRPTAEGAVQVAGGAASTADLTSVVVGQASGYRLTSRVPLASLAFAGKRFSAAEMTVGDAGGGEANTEVTSASADIDASVIEIAKLNIGDSSGTLVACTVGQADVTLTGGAATVGGLVLGRASATMGTGAQTSASLEYTGSGFTATGDWEVGVADSKSSAPTTVHSAVATIPGGAGSTADLTSLVVGASTGTGSRSTALVTQADLLFAGVAFDADTVVVGRADAHYDGAVSQISSTHVQLDASTVLAGGVSVGQASAGLGSGSAGGSALVQGATLEVRADAFQIAGTLVIGEVASNRSLGLAQTIGAVTVRGANTRAGSLDVGIYTGDGTGDTTSYADGLLTLDQTRMDVVGDAVVGVVHSGQGSATGELALDASLLDVGGVLMLGPGATISVPTAGLSRGVEYGGIDAGSAELDGTLELDLLYTPQLGDSWDILRLPGGSVFQNDFASVLINDLPAQYAFVAEMVADAAGRSVYRVRITNVPEPTVTVLLVLGFALFLLRRPRRRITAA